MFDSNHNFWRTWWQNKLQNLWNNGLMLSCNRRLDVRTFEFANQPDEHRNPELYLRTRASIFIYANHNIVMHNPKKRPDDKCFRVTKPVKNNRRSNRHITCSNNDFKIFTNSPKLTCKIRF